MKQIKIPGAGLVVSPQKTKHWMLQNRLTVLVAVLGVCVVALLFAVASSAFPDKPEKVAVTFLGCMTRYDFKGAEKCVSEDIWFDAKQMERDSDDAFRRTGLSLKEARKLNVDFDVSVDDVETGRVYSKVWLTFRMGKMKQSGWVELRKEKKGWRVYDIDPNFSGMTGGRSRCF